MLQGLILFASTDCIKYIRSTMFYWSIAGKLWSYVIKYLIIFVVSELASRQHTWRSWSVPGNWTVGSIASVAALDASAAILHLWMRSKHPSPQQHVRCFLFYPNAALLLNAQKHCPAVKQGRQILVQSNNAIMSNSHCSAPTQSPRDLPSLPMTTYIAMTAT